MYHLREDLETFLCSSFQQDKSSQNSSTSSVSLFLSVIALNNIKIKCLGIPKTQSNFEYEDSNQLKVNKYLRHAYSEI